MSSIDVSILDRVETESLAAEFEHSSKDDLLTHISLQRALIRKLYTRIVELEQGSGGISKSQLSLRQTQSTAASCTSSSDGMHLHGISTSHSGSSTPTPQGGVAERLQSELDNVRRVLYSSEADSLNMETMRQLEATERQLLDALGALTEPGDVERYKHQVTARSMARVSSPQFRAASRQHELEETYHNLITPRPQSFVPISNPYSQNPHSVAPSSARSPIRYSAPPIKEQTYSPSQNEPKVFHGLVGSPAKQSGTASTTDAPVSLLRKLQYRLQSDGGKVDSMSAINITTDPSTGNIVVYGANQSQSGALTPCGKGTNNAPMSPSQRVSAYRRKRASTPRK